MDTQLLLIGLFVAGFFVTITVIIVSFIFKPQDSTFKSRVERLSTLPEELRTEMELGSDTSRKSLLSGIDIQPLIGRFTGEGYFEHLEQDLARADIPLRPSEFLIIRLVAVILGTLLTMLISQSVLIGLGAGLILLFIHSPVIGFLKARRIKRFTNQLADFLILIVNSLRAGQTFMQGCSVAVNESPNPIAAEFKQVIKEVNLGLPEAESLENLVVRVPGEDIKIVVSAYIIQRRVGGNLAEIFDSTAATIRERIKIQGQIDVLTTQGKLSGVIVGLMPFIVGIMISSVNPAYMEPLFTTTLGYFIIGFGLILQAIGIYAIWKIVSIDI